MVRWIVWIKPLREPSALVLRPLSYGSGRSSPESHFEVVGASSVDNYQPNELASVLEMLPLVLGMSLNVSRNSVSAVDPLIAGSWLLPYPELS